MHDAGGGGGWSRWIAGAAGAALGFLVTMAFGQDRALVAQGKQAFNDHGCYGCQTLGRRQAGCTVFEGQRPSRDADLIRARAQRLIDCTRTARWYERSGVAGGER